MSKLLLILLILFNAYLFINATQSTKADLWHNTSLIPVRTINAFTNFADSFHDAQVESVKGG